MAQAQGAYVSPEGNATILLVLHKQGGTLVLDPKPGGEKVKQGKSLNLVAINQSGATQTVTVSFATPIEATGGPDYVFDPIDDGGTATKSLTVDSAYFTKYRINPRLKVVTTNYEVFVAGSSDPIDPDLRIER
jgi:hypothetical protein